MDFNLEDTKIGKQELERQLENFRNIAEQRQAQKVRRWVYHLPFILSIAIFLSQLFNTGILFSYSREFTKLYDLLVDYMNETEFLNSESDNETLVMYSKGGINAERIDVIYKYHEQLWTLFITEVIELLMPVFNIMVFAWTFVGKKELRARTKIIYVVVPSLALILSLSQACMIQISLADRVHGVRFVLGKILSPLLEHNPNGSVPIERTFQCQLNDDDIPFRRNSTPWCSSVLHDEVISLTTLDVLIFLHIVPIFAFLYLLLRNLAQGDAEHLFLYVESLENRLDEVQSSSESPLGSSSEAAQGSTGQIASGIIQESSRDDLKLAVTNLLQNSSCPEKERRAEHFLNETKFAK